MRNGISIHRVPGIMRVNNKALLNLEYKPVKRLNIQLKRIHFYHLESQLRQCFGNAFAVSNANQLKPVVMVS